MIYSLDPSARKRKNERRPSFAPLVSWPGIETERKRWQFGRRRASQGGARRGGRSIWTGLTVAEEDGVQGREERAAEGVALAPPAPLPLRLGAVRPLGLPQLLPLLAQLHPPVLPLRRHCRPHLHRLHNLHPAATSGLRPPCSPTTAAAGGSYYYRVATCICRSGPRAPPNVAF